MAVFLAGFPYLGYDFSLFLFGFGDRMAWFRLSGPLVETQTIDNYDVKKYDRAKRTAIDSTAEDDRRYVEDAVNDMDSFVDDLRSTIDRMNENIEKQRDEIDTLHQLIHDLASEFEYPSLWVEKYDKSMFTWICDNSIEATVFPYGGGAWILFKDDEDGAARTIFTLHFLRGN